METLLTVLCTLGILIVVPALSVLYREFTDRVGLGASRRLTAAITLASAALWLPIVFVFPSIAASALYWPLAALAGLSGFLASLTVRDTTTAARPALFFSLVWTVLVFVPVALLSFFPTLLGIGTTDGPLDLGGALPVHVAVGSGALVVLTVARRWNVPDHSHIRPRSWLLVGAGLVLWIGWILGYIGLELGYDAVVTPRILTNTVLAPLGAIVGWLIIQRIRLATTTALGAVCGLVCGIVAIAAGCAFFTPLWATVTGIVAGIAGAIFVTGWVRATSRHAWILVGVHLLAGAIGLLMVGLFGTGFGLIYSGQTALFQTQFVSIVAVVLWAGIVTLLLWLVVRAVALRARRRAASIVQPVASEASA